VFEFRPPRSRRGGRPRLSAAERLAAACARAAERAAAERARLERRAPAPAPAPLLRVVRSEAFQARFARATGLRWSEDLEAPEVVAIALRSGAVRKLFF
jgi:hypothetical protein